MLHSTGGTHGEGEGLHWNWELHFPSCNGGRKSCMNGCLLLNGARSDSSPWLSAMRGESLPLFVEPARIYFHWPGMTPDPPYDPIIPWKTCFCVSTCPIWVLSQWHTKNANNIHPNLRIQLTFLSLRFLFVWTKSLGMRTRARGRERCYYLISS